MIKRSLILTWFLVLPTIANSANYGYELKANNRSFYGVMDTHKKSVGTNNLPNRKVNRTDSNFKAFYQFNSDYKLTFHNRSAMIFKEHDKNFRDGEWRFYNYGSIDSPFGQVTLGEAFNVANQFHRGGKDNGPLGLEDTNMSYFLSNPNGGNGKHSTHFYTPKSTSIMNDGRAFKVSYITPEFYDTFVGFSYIPDNRHRRGMNSRYTHYEKTNDGYVVALHNESETSFGDLYTSIGYGFFNRTDKELSLGATLTYGGFTYALGYKSAYVDGNKNPIATTRVNNRLPAFHDNYRESQSYDASLGYEIGPYKTSISYLHTEAKNTPHQDDLVIFSNTYAYSSWLDLYLVGGYINAQGIDKSDSVRNKGYAGIVGISLNLSVGN